MKEEALHTPAVKKVTHTPGPWYAVNYAGYHRIQSTPYYDANNDLLDEECCRQEAVANAALIASAPDLLSENIRLKEEVEAERVRGLFWLKGKQKAESENANLREQNKELEEEVAALRRDDSLPMKAVLLERDSLKEEVERLTRESEDRLTELNVEVSKVESLLSQKKEDREQKKELIEALGDFYMLTFAGNARTLKEAIDRRTVGYDAFEERIVKLLNGEIPENNSRNLLREASKIAGHHMGIDLQQRIEEELKLHGL